MLRAEVDGHPDYFQEFLMKDDTPFSNLRRAWGMEHDYEPHEICLQVDIAGGQLLEDSSTPKSLGWKVGEKRQVLVFPRDDAEKTSKGAAAGSAGKGNEQIPAEAKAPHSDPPEMSSASDQAKPDEALPEKPAATAEQKDGVPKEPEKKSEPETKPAPSNQSQPSDLKSEVPAKALDEKPEAAPDARGSKRQVEDAVADQSKRLREDGNIVQEALNRKTTSEMFPDKKGNQEESKDEKMSDGPPDLTERQKEIRRAHRMRFLRSVKSRVLIFFAVASSKVCCQYRQDNTKEHQGNVQSSSSTCQAQLHCWLGKC